MRKTILDCLEVEITRRCNMKPVCRHCYRGMPQNVDLSKTAIDNLLDQVIEISDLRIGGGEPLVNSDGIKYLFNGIIERNIAVGRLIMTTNGLIYSDDFINTFLRMNEYMKSCRSKYADELLDRMTIAVSADQYHNNNAGKPFLEKCDKVFEEAGIVVRREMSGAVSSKEGRGKDIKYAAENDKETVRNRNNHAIEYIIPGQNNCYCPKVQSTTLLYVNAGKRDANLILCPLTLDAKGRLLFNGNSEYDTQDTFTPICDLNNNIDLMSAVPKYNIGKQKCYNIPDKSREAKVSDIIKSAIETYTSGANPIVATLFGIKEDDRLHYANTIDKLANVLAAHQECNIINIMGKHHIDMSKLLDQKCTPKKHTVDDEDFEHFLDAYLTPDSKAVRW